MQLTNLYSAVEVHDHILPIAFLLVDDRVYQVRITALRVVRLHDMADLIANCTHIVTHVHMYTHCTHIFGETVEHDDR